MSADGIGGPSGAEDESVAAGRRSRQREFQWAVRQLASPGPPFSPSHTLARLCSRARLPCRAALGNGKMLGTRARAIGLLNSGTACLCARLPSTPGTVQATARLALPPPTLVARRRSHRKGEQETRAPSPSHSRSTLRVALRPIRPGAPLWLRHWADDFHIAGLRLSLHPHSARRTRTPPSATLQAALTRPTALSPGQPQSRSLCILSQIPGRVGGKHTKETR